MLKNNKGFSLVELLSVIIILVLIGLVAVPAVTKLLNDSRHELYDTQIDSIKEGAKNWVADHPRSLPKEEGEAIYISLGQLKIGSYVDMRITDPLTDMLFDTETRVIIMKRDGKYIYEVIVDEDKSGEEDKNAKIDFPTIAYNGDLVVYLNVGDTYDDAGLLVDNELCVENNCNIDGYYASFIINKNESGAGIDTSVAGNYYVEYIITDRHSGRDLALFRTVIVK